jgi:DNA-binding NtrC family response regulator
MSESDEIDVPVLEALANSGAAAPNGAASIDALVDQLLTSCDDSGSRYRDVERAMLRRALDLTNGNKSAAARLLGLPRKALTRRWARLDDTAADEDDGDDE